MVVAPTMYGLPYLFPQTSCLEKNPVDVGKNLASFSTPEISHSPNNSNFHVITLSLLLYHFFLISGIMYKYVMLIFINHWLLNLICNMAKAMNGQNSYKQNFQPFFYLSMLFEKPCFSLFSSLLLPFFISNFINFFWPHCSSDSIAYELIKCIQFKIIENQLDETLM